MRQSCDIPCSIPCSIPTVPLGPCGVGSYGGYGSGIVSGGMGYGGGVSASSLGIVPGAAVSCISQIPPSEVIIQPPAYNMVIPGPIIVSSGEPVRVGGYSPCASGYGYGSSVGSSGGGYLGGGYLGGGSIGGGSIGGGYKGIGGGSKICGFPC